MMQRRFYVYITLRKKVVNYQINRLPTYTKIPKKTT